MKKSLLLLIPLLFTVSCKKNNSFVVNGHINNAKQNHIYISRVDINSTVVIDSVKLGKKGNFRFRVNSKEPDFYEVGYSKTDFITLLATPGEKISLTFDGDNLYNAYNVTGSKGSEQVRLLDYRLIKTKLSLDSLSNIYDKISKEPGSEAQKAAIEQSYLNFIKEQRRFNIVFIIQNSTSLATIKALYQRINDNMYVLYDVHDLQYMKIASDSLKRHYPESKHTKALISDFSKEMNQLYANEINQLTASIPVTKLDPDCKDLNGKVVTLSSLKGKYVLLAFWSSESRDCIVENLQLKEYYKLYHAKGFEIYQIDLDRDEAAWRQAVRFDALPWINTRENDPLNPKFARLFNVKVLPANYLFDPKGELVAIDLHGKTLQLKLSQLFEK